MTGSLVNHPLNVVLKDNHKGPGGGRVGGRIRCGLDSSFLTH